MKQSWLRFLSIVLLLLLTVSVVAAAGFLLPAQYEKAFTGEFDDMVARLKETKEPKLIVVGGSSVAFGVDAKLLGETLGMPVVNFGLYATLGTKTMLDYSKANLGEGDIVVIAPELNTQTWSMYFNAESMWQAIDGHFGLLRYLNGDDAPAMLGAFWKLASGKTKFFLQKTDLDPEGIYNASSFDEFGFIRHNRTKDYNVMVGGYDASMTLRFDPAIFDEEFIEYVNDYVRYAKKKGATVYLGFCPMNEDALDPDTTMETLDAYVAALRENFDCELLGEPNSYLYRSGYFYDSNFHLNSAGAVVHTRRLALDLAAILPEEIEVKIDVPAVPEIPETPDEPEEYEYDENEVYFLYDVKDTGVEIVGVSDLGKTQTVLTTPKAFDGKKVVMLTSGTFADCGNLTELFVTENISQIHDGTFEGAGNLTKIHMASSNPDNCIVNSMSGEAFVGTSSKCRVYVPNGALSDYKNNYFWGIYSNLLTEEN